MSNDTTPALSGSGKDGCIDDEQRTRRARPDGGAVSAGSNAELIDAGAAPVWKGPFTEYDKYGEPTGAEYVRCSACGVEVLAGDTEHATHSDGCDMEGDGC